MRRNATFLLAEWCRDGLSIYFWTRRRRGFCFQFGLGQSPLVSLVFSLTFCVFHVYCVFVCILIFVRLLTILWFSFKDFCCSLINRTMGMGYCFLCGRSQLTKLIIEIFLDVRLYHESKIRNKRDVNIRQKYTKLILFKNQ